MAKNSKRRDAMQKTQNKEKARKDTKKKVKKEPDDKMTHKRRSKAKKTKKYSFKQVLQGFADTLKSLRTIMINLIIIAIFFFLIFICYRELKTDFALIEPFEVPQELEKQGYTGRALTNKLIDQINLIRTTARTRMESAKMIPIWLETQIELEVPGGGISLTSLVNSIKRLFGREPISIVSEIVIYNKHMCATIRVNGKPAKTIRGELENLDEILLQAAEHICRYIQPYILASYLYAIDNRKASLETIRYILSHEPIDDDPWAYNLWGLALYAQKDYEGAIAKYQKVFELDPKFALAYSNWGLALYAQKDYEGAIAKYQKAIELDPKFAAPYSHWGLALCYQEDYEGAIAKCQKAIELDSKYAYPYSNWGLVLMDQGKYEGAIAKYQKAIELDPKFALAYSNWGWVLYEQRDYEGAIAKYQKVIELDPGGELGKIARQQIQLLEKNKEETEEENKEE